MSVIRADSSLKIPNMFLSNLKLSAIACHGRAHPDGTNATFDARGGTIGRSADSTLTLPDDDAIDERHAAVRASADGWQFVTLSATTRVAVNGRVIAAGEQTRLQSGDVVMIGAYVLLAASGEPVTAQTAPETSHASPWDFSVRAPLDLTDASRAWPERPSADTPEPFPSMSAAFAPSNDPLDPTGATTGLDDLLDTPVDPLALFGAPRQPWSHADGLDDAALFDDLPSIAIDAPVPPQPRPQPPTAFAPPSLDFGRASIITEPAMQCVVRVGVPQYGGLRNVKAAPAQTQPDVTNHDPALARLAHAFLDGAGVAADAPAQAGVTVEFMHALGTFTRALRQSRESS